MLSGINGCKGLARRLLCNTAGNTMALTAAAILPLIAMVGGAVDMSRAYLVKTRLQTACDAGALAARRAMNGHNWTAAVNTTAQDYFRLNFRDGKYGSSNLTVNYASDSKGVVTGQASAIVPMTLMQVFNSGDTPVSVQCTAELNLPNTDVMLVLDTTLSMNDTNPGDSVSRITALRNAVLGFYDTLEAAKPSGAKIRYGFVPYSQTVNVGMLLNREWIQDQGIYDSRVPDGTHAVGGTPQGPTITTYSNWTYISGTYQQGTPYPGPAEKCLAPANVNYSDTTTSSAWTPSSTALPRSRVRTRIRNGTTYTASLNNSFCTITPHIYNQFRQEQTETVQANPNAGQISGGTTYFHWLYQPVVYDLTPLTGSGNGPVTGGSMTAQVANNHGNRTVTWNQSNACIEERATRRTDESFLVPRHDMDIDLIPDPTRPETQWKPHLPDLVFARNASGPTSTNGWMFSGSPPTVTRTVNLNATINYWSPFGSVQDYAACPSPARKLGEITRSSLTTYLNGLVPRGFTYHDIGMVWGLRLMSREGLFANEHEIADANGAAVRHLIFMADGETDTRYGTYSAWGVSGVTRRRTPITSLPSNAQENGITESNLAALCTKAKSDKGIIVWVIAFGTDLTPLLQNCASPDRAYKADNAQQLITTFANIATQMAELRLTK